MQCPIYFHEDFFFQFWEYQNLQQKHKDLKEKEQNKIDHLQKLHQDVNQSHEKHLEFKHALVADAKKDLNIIQRDVQQCQNALSQLAADGKADTPGNSFRTFSLAQQNRNKIWKKL